MVYLKTWNKSKPFLLGGTLLFSSAAIIYGQADPSGKDDKPKTSLKKSEGKKSEIELRSTGSLIEDLKSEEFSIRRKAKAEIWARGKKSIPELQKHVKSEDPEVRYTVKRLINFVRLGITKDTPEKVFELVEEILVTKDLNVTYDNLRTLQELKAYPQIIFLNSVYQQKEEHADVARKMIRVASLESLPKLLSKSLEKEDYVEAEEWLNELPLKGKVAYLLVELYSLQGKLAELEARHKKESEVYRYISAYKRNVREFQKNAELSGDQEALARANILLGKPGLYIEKYIKNLKLRLKPGEKAKSLKTVKYALEIADAIEANDQQKAKKMTEDLRAVYPLSIDVQAITQIQGALLINGDASTLNNSFEQLYVTLGENGFRSILHYIKHSEQVPTLFKQLGLPVETDALKAWAKRQHMRARGDVELDEPYSDRTRGELRKLFMVAGLYNHRCERENVKIVLEPFLKGLRKYTLTEKGKQFSKDRYIEVLQELVFNNDDLSWYLDEEINDLSGEEIDKLVESIIKGYPQDYNFQSVWNALKKGKADTKALREYLSISGTVKGEGVVSANEIQEKLMKKAGDDISLRKGLYHCAISRGDAYSVRDMSPELIGKMNSNIVEQWLDIMNYGFGDYEEFCKAKELEDQEDAVDDPDLLTWSVALRKIGKIDEAETKLKEYRMKRIGTSNVWWSIAYIHAESGCKEVALDAFERYFLSLDPKVTNVSSVVELFSRNFFYEETEQWEKAYGIALINKYGIITGLYKEQSLYPPRFLNVGHRADFCKGMFMLKNGENEGEFFIKRAAESSVAGGNLAESYFPALRKAGYHRLNEYAYNIASKAFEASLASQPNCANTLNSYAWTAARAGLDLEKAKRNSEKSLKINPHTPSYIDTLAEVYFSMGNREKAIEVGNLAVQECLNNRHFGESDVSTGTENSKLMRGQLQHFIHDPLPKSK